MTETTTCEDFDTVVIGGGIVGLFASWFLAEDGAAVLCLNDGLNAGSFANAGSLHGQTQSRMDRMFPERVADYQKTLAIYPRAIDQWAEIAKLLDEDIEYQLGGGLMIAETPQQLESLRVKSAVENRCGIETAILTSSEALAMAPYLRDDILGALFCPKEGKVNPLTATCAIHRAAIAKGAQVINDARVTRCEAVSTGYRVHSSVGEYQTRQVLIAAGAGSGELAASLGVRIPVSAEPLHMNVTEPMQDFLPYLVQHAELALTMKQLKTGQLLIGGGWPAQHTAGQPTPTVITESLFGNLALARYLVPGIAGLQIQRSWAGINTMVDLTSVIGEVDASPGVFLAIPGDAGYTLAPYCARLVVDLMAGRPSDFPLEFFSPRRFGS